MLPSRQISPVAAAGREHIFQLDETAPSFLFRSQALINELHSLAKILIRILLRCLRMPGPFYDHDLLLTGGSFIELMAHADRYHAVFLPVDK